MDHSKRKFLMTAATVLAGLAPFAALAETGPRPRPKLPPAGSPPTGARPTPPAGARPTPPSGSRPTLPPGATPPAGPRPRKPG